MKFQNHGILLSPFLVGAWLSKCMEIPRLENRTNEDSQFTKRSVADVDRPTIRGFLTSFAIVLSFP